MRAQKASCRPHEISSDKQARDGRLSEPPVGDAVTPGCGTFERGENGTLRGRWSRRAWNTRLAVAIGGGGAHVVGPARAQEGYRPPTFSDCSPGIISFRAAQIAQNDLEGWENWRNRHSRFSLMTGFHNMPVTSRRLAAPNHEIAKRGDCALKFQKIG